MKGPSAGNDSSSALAATAPTPPPPPPPPPATAKAAGAAKSLTSSSTSTLKVSSTRKVVSSGGTTTTGSSTSKHHTIVVKKSAQKQSFSSSSSIISSSVSSISSSSSVSSSSATTSSSNSSSSTIKAVSSALGTTSATPTTTSPATLTLPKMNGYASSKSGSEGSDLMDVDTNEPSPPEPSPPPPPQGSSLAEAVAAAAVAAAAAQDYGTLEDVPRLLKRSPSAGERWYVLEKKWYDACMAHITEGGPSPGQIDNSAIVAPMRDGDHRKKDLANTKFGLAPNLAEERDIVIVPEPVWFILLKAFGIVNSVVGGQPIICPVVQTAPNSNYYCVEYYPLELKLAIYNSKQDMVLMTYSRNTTLREIIEDMKRRFGVPAETEVQLWHNATMLVSCTDFDEPPAAPSSTNANSSPSQNSTDTASSSAVPNSVPFDRRASPQPPPPSPSATASASTSTATFGPQQKPSATATEPPPTVNRLDQLLNDLDLAVNSVLTLELQNPDGTWPSSRTKMGAVTRSKAASGVPITDPGVCGLMNLGNTCFMNSALQCLSNTPPLTEFLLSDAYLEDINETNPLGMGGEIARRYAELIKALWSGYHISLSPREFKVAVSRFAPQFSGFTQHDCQELMAFLLDGLHEDLNRVKKKPYIEAKEGIEQRPDEEVAEESWSNYKLRNDSIIVDTFHSQLKSTLVCPECQLVSVTFDPNCYLTLPLPFKRERPINLVFVPAISKRLTVAAMRRDGKDSSSQPGVGFGLFRQHPNATVRSLVVEHVMVPKSGIIADVIVAIAKALNEYVAYDGAPVFNRVIDPTRLRINGIFMNRCNRYYASDDTIPNHIDDVVVFEEDDYPVDTSEEGASPANTGAGDTPAGTSENSTSSSTSSFTSSFLAGRKAKGYVLPVFIRESRDGSDASISRPFLINVKRLTYENIQEAIFQELLTCLRSPDDVAAFLEAMNGITGSGSEGPDSPANNDKRSGSRLHPPSSLLDGSDGESLDCDYEDASSGGNTNGRGKQRQRNNGGGGSSNEDSGGEEDIEEDEDEDEGVGSSSMGNGSPQQGDHHHQLPQQTRPFTISVVNQYATSDYSVLGPGTTLDTFTNTFLAVNIDTKIVKQFFSSDLNVHRQVALSQLLPNGGPIRQSRTHITLAECIQQFTTTEKLGSEDPWYCPRCKKHQMADKKFDIWSLPKILIIHLKRFQYSRLHREKLDVLVDFPVRGMDMTPFVLHNPQRRAFRYDLIGVSNHFGGLGGGHYTAFAKNCRNKRWYNFDDSSVSAQAETNLVSKSAYVLFYQLQDGSNSSEYFVAAPETIADTPPSSTSDSDGNF